MSHYLHVAIGEFQMLIDTDQILAVADGSDAGTTQEEARFQWQDRALPICRVFDAWLQQHSRRTGWVVLGHGFEDRQAFALPVDAIIGTRLIDERLMTAVPSFNEEFGHRFDAALQDPEQAGDTCLLRLRDPASSLAPHKENAG